MPRRERRGLPSRVVSGVGPPIPIPNSTALSPKPSNEKLAVPWVGLVMKATGTHVDDAVENPHVREVLFAFADPAAKFNLKVLLRGSLKL